MVIIVAKMLVVMIDAPITPGNGGYAAVAAASFLVTTVAMTIEGRWMFYPGIDKRVIMIINWVAIASLHGHAASQCNTYRCPTVSVIRYSKTRFGLLFWYTSCKLGHQHFPPQNAFLDRQLSMRLT